MSLVFPFQVIHKLIKRNYFLFDLKRHLIINFIINQGEGCDDDDTSVPLAIRQVTFLLEIFSFGESKRENVRVEVVARAATPLVVSSSSSSSSSSSLSEENSSCVIKTILPDFL